MTRKPSFSHGADLPTRRAFLSRAATGLLGVTAAPFMGSLAPGQALGAIPGAGVRRSGVAQRVIYLFMSGGMSHLDTFDPKPGQETQGPTESQGTKADGVRVASNFRHLAGQMDKVCLFSGMSSTQGAHQQAQYFMHTSYQMRGTIKHPSMGAWMGHLSESQVGSLPGHVLIGGGQQNVSAGFLPSVHGPLPIGDPEAGLQHATRHRRVDQQTFDRRLDRLKKLDAEFQRKHGQKAVRSYADMYDQATELMTSSELGAFDLKQEPEAIRQSYGSERIGQACLLARRLVEHDVRYVQVSYGGWDTHNQNFDSMDDLIPPLDRALAALLADLEARGLLDETLVVLATEFGRTPDIVAGREGRNHYPKAFSCLMAGGGIQGGQRYGETDAQGREVADRQVSIPDFNATIAWAVGLDTEKKIMSPSGRPFTVADKGRPITEVFA